MTSRLGIFYVHNGAVKQQPIKCTIRNSNKRESPYLIIIEKYLYSLKPHWDICHTMSEIQHASTI
jgi:hypothetical protein